MEGTGTLVVEIRSCAIEFFEGLLQMRVCSKNVCGWVAGGGVTNDSSMSESYATVLSSTLALTLIISKVARDALDV